MSEVMVVPMARTRMSNNPKKGDGFFDVIKSVGKAVAPIAIDAGRSMIKDKYGFGIDLSPAQVRSLKKGGAIQINPRQIAEQGKHLLQLLPQSAKKLINALKKSKGMRLLLKKGEDVIDRLKGGSIFGFLAKAVAPMIVGALGKSIRGKGGIYPAGARGDGMFDVLKSVGKAVAPLAIDAGSKYAKKKMRGDGMFDVLKSVGKAVAPMVVDAGSKYVKKRISGKGSSPYVSGAYDDAMDRHSQGGGFFDVIKSVGKAVAPLVIDAGSSYAKKRMGGGMYPAGSGMFPAGGAITQLGSPYQNQNSPAMNPFVGTTGLSGYAPITGGVSRSGGSMLPMDTGVGRIMRPKRGSNSATYAPEYISM